jgi:TPR repeat protein
MGKIIYGRGYLGHPDYQKGCECSPVDPPQNIYSVPREPLPDIALLSFFPYQESARAAEWRAWYTNVARAGDLQSQMYPGRWYEWGSSGWGERPVPQDLALAYYWYSRATAQGDPTAKQDFQRVARKIGPRDLARARRILGERQPKPK